MSWILICGCSFEPGAGLSVGLPGGEGTGEGMEPAATLGTDGGHDDDADGDTTGPGVAETTGEGVIFDLGSPDAAGVEGCGAPPPEPDASEIVGSYIWVSNSNQGTVSKVNTETLVEEGRYAMGPESYYDEYDGLTMYDADPSRTSVSPAGDAAIADRRGGVTKVIALTDQCPDLDGDGTVETSTGPDDVLPWGEDECVAWSWYGEGDAAPWWIRAVGWTKEPVWSAEACRYEYELWIAGPTHDGAMAWLLGGTEGDVRAAVPIPDFDGSPHMDFYGGAVDADGNFWTHEKGTCMCPNGEEDPETHEPACPASEIVCPRLARVSMEDLTSRTWEYPIWGYGITVDSEGYVWLCSHDVARFDPATETFATATIPGANAGCMADGEGHVWLAGSPLQAVDVQTLEVVDTGPIPYGAHGVSVDHQGRIWGVPVGGGGTHGRVDRWDPVTETVASYEGLYHPYTYSDMTGVALLNAGSIPVPPAG